MDVYRQPEPRSEEFCEDCGAHVWQPLCGVCQMNRMHHEINTLQANLANLIETVHLATKFGWTPSCIAMVQETADETQSLLPAGLIHETRDAR